jgi:acetoin utilization deacetylase AcuC-like enzyme
MTVGIFWHPDILLHDRHANHAAMADDRIATVVEAVRQVPCTQSQLARAATLEELGRAHDHDYIARLVSSQALRIGEQLTLAPDTALNPHTWCALALSAGAACQAVDAVLAREVDHAFNPVYAGHHAARAGADGFCFVNTALVAAFHAQARGAERIAVLDFDVHSGNGTIDGLMARPEFLFAETFQPGYPGAFLQKTPRPAHILRKKCRSRRDVLRAWHGFFDTLRAWGPDVVVVSAGFDAHRADPLGTLNLLDEDYEWLARGLLSLGAPVVATLEGGYSVPDLARCAALFVMTLAAGSVPAGADAIRG